MQRPWRCPLLRGERFSGETTCQSTRKKVDWLACELYMSCEHFSKWFWESRKAKTSEEPARRGET